MSLTPAVSESRIAVLGLGYVGCVTAACLASLGHRVVGVDRDEFKVKSVNTGQAPFYEPGLGEVVSETVAAGNLSASTELADAVREADVALICVGTPSEKNGNLGLDQLRRVSAEIAETLKTRPASLAPLVVAVRSTVFPGTCEEIVISALKGLASVVSNPEFLREGTAMRDFTEPAIVVVGGEDPAAVRQVADLYAPLNVKPCLVSLRTAEMIKYACNAFHAVKISFANEIGALAGRLEVNPFEVMDTLCQDDSLNISKAYLKPGFAFGGSCLPKDLRALSYRANRMDLDLPMLDNVLKSNAEHLQRAIEAVLDLPADRIGIFGLAFKENTDDLRESAVVTMLEQLIGKGRNLKVYDPYIKLDLIYGTNQQYIMRAIPHIGRLMETSFDDLAAWAQYLVIAQKPSAEFMEKIRQSGLPVLDLVGAFPASYASNRKRAEVAP